MARRSGSLLRKRAAVVFALLLAATAGTSAILPGVAIGGDHGFPGRARPTTPTARPERAILARDPQPEHLSSELARLARLAHPARPGATRPTIAVSILLSSSADAPGAIETIGRIGGHLRNHGATIVEADVPTDRLATLASAPGVRRVEPIRRPRPLGLTSAGVAIHGANLWQQAGYRGEGVRVGIIDGGFAGISDRLATEFPGGIQARCYSSAGTVSSSLAPCEADGETHGTAVAETIADMAPGATLYVANPTSHLEHLQTVAWMTSQGVRIINASFGSSNLFDGPGDGTSPDPTTFYSVIDAAVKGGALWVNAAGNSGDLGWAGPWTDTNDNGWLEFAGGDEANTLTIEGGETVDIAIRWSDPWGASANDYDLYLYPAGGTDPVSRSTDDQAGAGDPVERLTYTALTTGAYEIQVAKHAGTAVGRIQLLVGGADSGLSHQVVDGTLPSPADSANPGMVSVGAVNAASPDALEPYSSHGPTTDGRTKPDLVAADCADTTTIPQFCGTSQSAPYASGAAALLLQADPTLAPAQLAAALRAHATPLGGPIPNSGYGWGRLALGPAPAGPPPPAPPPPTPGPPPLGLKALSSAGDALTWRGMATSGTATVHVVFGERSVDGDSVVHRRSVDGGATFETGTVLSTLGVQAGYASVASAGAAVHVAWLEGDLGGIGAVTVWYRSSPDAGVTWTAPRPLSAIDGRSGNPGLAADAAGDVLAAWTDAATGRVLVAASADGGATFASPRAVGSTTLSPFSSLADLDGLPAIAFGGGGLAYVAWSVSPTRLLVRRTPDAGVTWLPVQTLDQAADGYSRPWLSAYGGGVAVAYGARPSIGLPAVAFIRRSSDRGATWQGRRQVSLSTTLASRDPTITMKGAVVRVAYAQCTTTACTRARVWYRQSSTGGSTWSSATALTGTSTYAYPTGIAATSRILVLYDAAASSAAETGTAYLRIR